MPPRPNLDKHAEGEVELVRPQLENIRLKGLLIFAWKKFHFSSFLQEKKKLK